MNNENHPIVLTNDDGFKSEGFNFLKKICKDISSNIWSFAPTENQSAKSQAITINKNILAVNCLRLMQNNEITYLIVTNKNKVDGLITIHNILDSGIR